MTRRENDMRERILSIEGQLVKAAIMVTEARERAEAAEQERDEFRAALDKGPAASVEAQAEINHWRERAEAAEKDAARLRKALKPFVEASDGETDTLLIRTDHPMFRRAHAALEAKP